jgi:TRAP-type C4-dicarboxylate transport system permease small subunit
MSRSEPESMRAVPPPRGPLESGWALRFLGPLAAVCLFAMMALTAVGVIARYFFNHPIAGDSEMQAFLLGFIVFSGIPLVTYRQRHIAVRSFAALLKGGALFVQRVFVLALTGCGFAFMAYIILLQAIELQEEGTLSTYLDIPEAPFTYIFAALMAIAALVAFALLAALLRGRELAEPYSRTEGIGPD